MSTSSRITGWRLRGAFRVVALDHSDTDRGIDAGMLYLQCLEVLGGYGQRPTCYDDMARDVPALRRLYCQTRRSVNAESCATLDRVDADIARLYAQKLVEQADAHANDAALYRAGAEKYLAVFESYCGPATTVIDRCDEIAFNAASAFIAAGDTAAATNVRALMLDPKNNMTKSPLTKRLSCKLYPSPPCTGSSSP